MLLQQEFRSTLPPQDILNEMSWGSRSGQSESMGPPSLKDGVKDITEAEAVKTRVTFTSRHFKLLLVLWISLDWQWQADGAQLINVSQMNVGRAQLMENASELNISRLQLIPASMLNVTLPAGVDLSNQNKTVKNDNVPLPVYVCVPLVTAAVSALLIYGFCSWRLKLLRRRKEIMEKQTKRRRRSSLKPGSSERGKKFGLTRAVGADGDPLIIPTAKLIGLARKLDDVEHLVLDYRSFETGDCIPEKHTYKVKEVAYDVSVNPLFNSLQSGACGYVLGGGDNTATFSPGTKKPEEGPDDDSDSDGNPKKRTSKTSILKAGSTTALPLLSRLSAESKSKEDPLRRLIANKSIVKEIQDETKGEEQSTEESSDDEILVASSAESLGTESYSYGTSEEESDDESAKKSAHDTPKSPTASRLSKTTSASDSMTRTSSTPKPLSPQPGPSKASVSAKASANPRASKAAVSTGISRSEKSGAKSGQESSSPRTSASKSAISGQEISDLEALSPKYSEIASSGENTPSTSRSSKSSPRSLTASSSPRATSTPRDSKAARSQVDSPRPKSGEESPRSSSAPRASKATVSGRNAPSTSKTAASGKDSKTSSPESSVRMPTKGPVSPTVSSVATSGKDQRSDSSKRAGWDPSTVPERSSIKKSSSRSQGSSPDEPSSPSTSSSTRNYSRRSSDSGSQATPM